MSRVPKLNTELQLMHDELESQQLTVALFPAPHPAFEGHMIRVPIESNVAWYRCLCSKYPVGVRSTKVRRADILRVLARLASGKPSSSQFADYLVQMAKKRIDNNPF